MKSLKLWPFYFLALNPGQAGLICQSAPQAREVPHASSTPAVAKKIDDQTAWTNIYVAATNTSRLGTPFMTLFDFNPDKFRLQASFVAVSSGKVLASPYSYEIVFASSAEAFRYEKNHNFSCSINNKQYEFGEAKRIYMPVPQSNSSGQEVSSILTESLVVKVDRSFLSALSESGAKCLLGVDAFTFFPVPTENLRRLLLQKTKSDVECKNLTKSDILNEAIQSEKDRGFPPEKMDYKIDKRVYNLEQYRLKYRGEYPEDNTSRMQEEIHLKWKRFWIVNVTPKKDSPPYFTSRIWIDACTGNSFYLMEGR